MSVGEEWRWECMSVGGGVEVGVWECGRGVEVGVCECGGGVEVGVYECGGRSGGGSV